ncbi:MAG: HAD-IB family phosphatase [Gammaproteobacteria bacterium]|nr:HAD-IB family phosphatase [Gammaproteobacteria bacterium]
MGLAIFDIDGTLVRGPSTEKRFFLELLRRGRVGPRQVAGFLWFLLRYLPRYGRHVFKKNKAYLAWLPEDEIRALVPGWVRGGLAGAWFAPCVERLRQHQRAGDTVVLVSGTPQFVAEGIGAALGVERVIGSGCVVEDGRFRARPPLNHPFRDEKNDILAMLLREYRADAAATAAYGDSIYDLPLLVAVGRAVAVRPDEQLLMIAQAAGWEVLGPVREGWWRRLKRGSLLAGLRNRLNQQR